MTLGAAVCSDMRSYRGSDPATRRSFRGMPARLIALKNAQSVIRLSSRLNSRNSSFSARSRSASTCPEIPRSSSHDRSASTYSSTSLLVIRRRSSALIVWSRTRCASGCGRLRRDASSHGLSAFRDRPGVRRTLDFNRRAQPAAVHRTASRSLVQNLRPAPQEGSESLSPGRHGRESEEALPIREYQICLSGRQSGALAI